MFKLTKEQFISKVQPKNPTIDFSNIIYDKIDDKITVKCSICGKEFTMLASSFKRTVNCPHCDLEKRKQRYLEIFKEKHGDKYDYSKMVYSNKRVPVEIICPIHGSFWQTPQSHANGYGCDKCSQKHRHTTEEWKEKVKNLYNGQYDLSKVEYIDKNTPVCVICPKHGEFWTRPSNYAKEVSGCPMCNNERKHEKYRKTTEQFIDDAKRVHGDKYDYSKVEYYNKETPITIICKKHGEFIQSPSSHLSGAGCPKCKNKTQTEIYEILVKAFPEETILYEHSPKWLGTQRFDIYFPKRNIAIEYDGTQHFKPVEVFGGEESFKKTKKLDKEKNFKCTKYNCKLIRIGCDYKDSDRVKLIDAVKTFINEEKFYTWLYKTCDVVKDEVSMGKLVIQKLKELEMF